MIQDIMTGLNNSIEERFKNIFKMDFYFDQDLDAIGWLRRDKYYLPTKKSLKIGIDKKKKYTEDIIVSYNRTPIEIYDEIWPNKKPPHDLSLKLKKSSFDKGYVDLRMVTPVTFNMTFAFLFMNAKTAEIFEILYLELLLGQVRFNLTYEFEGVEEPVILDYVAYMEPIGDINQVNFTENGSVRQATIEAKITGFVLSPLSNTEKLIKSITLNTSISNGDKASKKLKPSVIK